MTSLVLNSTVDYEAIKAVIGNNDAAFVNLNFTDSTDMLTVIRIRDKLPGYKPANFIRVSYVDTSAGDANYQEVGTEYFTPEQVDTAIEALKIRASSTDPRLASGVADAVQDIFEAE